MRARDALGRPLSAGSPDAVPEVPERALPPAQALELARELLAQGRAFGAHEVFEAVWKAAPAAQRDLWQGLAQVCVGLTHLQRGNRTGGARLLRRGAGRLAAFSRTRGAGGAGSAGLTAYDAKRLAARALTLADRVDAGEQVRPELPV